jgi:predicted aspartyl protease
MTTASPLLGMSFLGRLRSFTKQGSELVLVR